MKYNKVDNFVIKLRAYPTKEQAEKIDKALYGIRIAFNVSAYEMTCGNPLITNIVKGDESARWPDFKACMKASWLDWLREQYPVVNDVPSTSMSSTAYSIFKDMQKSHENFHPEIIPHVQAKTKKGIPKTHKDGSPVWKRTDKPMKLPCYKNEPGYKWEPEYYSKKRPRTSFTVQTASNTGFVFTEDSKTVLIGVTKIGKIKCRGWRYDLRFGNEPENTFQEFYGQKINAKSLGVVVSKDNCGDYWLVVKLQTVWVPDRSKAKQKIPVGVDVGIKDLAITSDGVKYENKKFKRAEKRHKRRLNRKLSRRWGWSNEKFREAHAKDRELEPSKGYEKIKLKNAKLERKIARRRSNHNHNVTMDIVGKSSFIGIEDLLVTGMMKNRHLAFSASDAAMSDVLSKLKYKAEWRSVPIVQIGRWEPSSQLCHVCGYQNRKVKNLNVRDWTCPQCGTYHDRDINAAINIREMALKKHAENEM